MPSRKSRTRRARVIGDATGNWIRLGIFDGSCRSGRVTRSVARPLCCLRDWSGLVEDRSSFLSSFQIRFNFHAFSFLLELTALRNQSEYIRRFGRRLSWRVAFPQTRRKPLKHREADVAGWGRIHPAADFSTGARVDSFHGRFGTPKTSGQGRPLVPRRRMDANAVHRLQK